MDSIDKVHCDLTRLNESFVVLKNIQHTASLCFLGLKRDIYAHC